MWTEVTKDLVIREAIDECGYSCEETDDFFYVMEYLKYVCCPSSPPDKSPLTNRRRTFCASSRSQMTSAASANFASSLSAPVTVTLRDPLDTMRSFTSVKYHMTGTASVTVKVLAEILIAAHLCSHHVTRSETPRSSRHVSGMDQPHAPVSASAWVDLVDDTRYSSA